MRALLPVLLAVACSPSGVVVVSDDTSSTSETSPGDTNVGEPGDTTGDTTGETQEEEEETNPFASFAGEYEGELWLFLESDWFDYELDECEVWSEVSEDGAVQGEGTCVLESGGGWGANAWGGNGGGWGDEEIPLTFTGELDEDGELSGLIEFELDYGYFELEPMALAGETDGEDMSLEFDGEVVTDWVTAFISGGGDLDR